MKSKHKNYFKSVFSNFSNFSKIISREIREKNNFEFLEKFSRRTQSTPDPKIFGSGVGKLFAKMFNECAQIRIEHIKEGALTVLNNFANNFPTPDPKKFGSGVGKLFAKMFNECAQRGVSSKSRALK
jgi:hypothetical protein